MKKILIVEDETLQATALKQLFSKDYEVFWAPDGGEAIRLAEEKVPDLIILDIILPGDWNGLDVLKKIRENPKTKMIPVVVLTNLDNKEEFEARGLGISDFFLKTNVSLTHLQDRVAELL